MVNKRQLHIAVIDNYDSFVFNIIHYLETSYEPLKISLMKNDEIEDDLLKKADALVLSPGPGIPTEAGDLMNVIDKYHNQKPILGICLGLQALVEYFGGNLKNLSMPLHGIATDLYKTSEHFLWQNIDFPTKIGHYHSWASADSYFPNCIEITAKNQDDIIMAIQHKNLPITAVQFHPESVLTTDGKQMIKNWIDYLNKGR